MKNIIMFVNNQLVYCISAVELRINRTTIAKTANNAKIIKFPIKLLNQDVEVEGLLIVDDKIDCSCSVFKELLVDNFAVRSSKVLFISVVKSGNNSQNIAS